MNLSDALRRMAREMQRNENNQCSNTNDTDKGNLNRTERTEVETTTTPPPAAAAATTTTAVVGTKQRSGSWSTSAVDPNKVVAANYSNAGTNDLYPNKCDTNDDGNEGHGDDFGDDEFDLKSIKSIEDGQFDLDHDDDDDDDENDGPLSMDMPLLPLDIFPQDLATPGMTADTGTNVASTSISAATASAVPSSMVLSSAMSSVESLRGALPANVPTGVTEPVPFNVQSSMYSGVSPASIDENDKDGTTESGKSRPRRRGRPKTKRVRDPATIPAPDDVICGRGRLCNTHPGNLYFQSLVETNLEEYSKATGSKQDKSRLVSLVLGTITDCGGSFVKRNAASGVYEKIGSRASRERIGQAFRDTLHIHYKSSTASKRQRWKNDMDIQSQQVSHFLRDNETIAKAVRHAQTTVHDEMDDTTTERVFDEVNRTILTELKRCNITEKDLDSQNQDEREERRKTDRDDEVFVKDHQEDRKPQRRRKRHRS